MTTPELPQPKMWDRVRWRSPASDDGETLPRDYPAVITRVLTPYNVSLFIMQQTDTQSLVNVPFDESENHDTPETWYWLPTE